MPRLQLTTFSIFQLKHLLRTYNCPDYVLGLALYFYQHFKIPNNLKAHQITTYEKFLGCLLMAMKLSYDDSITNKTYSKYTDLSLKILCCMEMSLLDQLGLENNPKKEVVIQCACQMLSTLYGD